MSGISIVILGTMLASAGLGIWLIAWAISRWTALETPAGTSYWPMQTPIQEEQPENAIMIVAQGGRVVYLNSLARDWLNLSQTDFPSLEYILHRVRPAEQLLNLCNAAGHATLTVGALPVEAHSYLVPYGREQAMLIAMRPLELLGGDETAPTTAIHSLQLFAELVQSIGKELEIEEAVLAVAQAVDRVLPNDFTRISLWDEESQTLTPYIYSSTSSTEHTLERKNPHPPQTPFTKHIISTHTSLLIPDVQNPPPEFRGGRSHQPKGSYVGAPMLIGEKLIGLIEVGSATTNAFSRPQQEFLSMFAGAAAATIHNARLFTEAKTRLRELQSLADLASAVSGSKELHSLIQKILESIRPLTSAEMLGILLYDELHRDLTAQTPFMGLPDAVLSSYRGHVGVNSKAEEIIRSQKPIVIPADAPNDERIKALGFSDFYTAASIHATMLYPLTSGDQFLGYLQIANTPDHPPFSEEEERVLGLAASQVAPLLENAVLFQQARERARRAEALRRIASLAASSATADEMLKFSVLELAHLLNVEKAAVLLLDEENSRLVLHTESLVGIPEQIAREIDQISAQHPRFSQTVARTGEPFISSNVQTDERILEIYRPFLQALPDVKSALAVPLKTERGSLGEIMLLSRQEGRFDKNDLQLVAATSSQIALALERQRLLSQSDVNLRKRVEEMSALARLGRELALLSSLDEVLRYAHKQMLDLTGASCGLIMLLTKHQSGYKIKHHVGSKHCPVSLTPLDKEALERRQALAVPNYNTDMLPPPHEGVLSSLSIPLIYQGNIVGLAHLHSDQVGLFNPQNIRFAQLLARHVAVAIGNAQKQQNLLDENAALQLKARALTLLRQFLHTHQPLKDLDSALSDLTVALREVTPFDAIWVGKYESDKGIIEPLTSVGFQPGKPLPWDSLSLLLEDRFEESGIYFIPSEERQPLPSNLKLPQPETPIMPSTEPNSWRPQDMLLAPLRSSNRQVIGLLYLNSPRNGLRPSKATLDIIHVFAQQIAWLLEAFKARQSLIERQEMLEEQARQAEEALHTAQDNVPRWLRKDLQQALDRYRLAQQANRLRKGLEIAALVNRQPGRSAVLDALGAQLIEQFGFNYVLIAEPARQEHKSIRLARAFGDLPTELKIDILLGQRNPLTEVIHKGKVIMVPDLQRDREWATSPLLQRLEIQGFVAFPIYTERINEKGEQTGERVISHIVMAASCTPLLAFSEEDDAIFRLVSRQVGIALDNLTMLSRTERRLREAALLLKFSSQLGVLDPERILTTLLESTFGVLQNVHAGFVALWDAEESVLKPVAAAGYARSESMKSIALPQESLPAQVMLSGKSKLIEELDFAAAYPLQTEDLLNYRNATAERLPISSLIVPIRSGEHPLGVVVLDNFNAASAFSPDDERLVFSLAQQTALALENARLLNTAKRRASQLQALAKVSASITSHSLSYEEVTLSLLGQLAEVLPYDRGTLWLLSGNRLTLSDARGFENNEELIGITTNVEDSALFQEMVEAKKPLVVPDVTEDPRFPSTQPLPYRSWLGVPLVSKDKVLGVIALEKEEKHFFTPDWVETAETFAAQAAAALENARLYEETLRRTAELDERTRRLSLVYQLTADLATSLDPDYIVRHTADRLHEALGKGRVAAVLWKDKTPTLVAEFPEPEKETAPFALPADAPLWEHMRAGGGVFHSQDVTSDPLLEGLRAFIGTRKASGVVAVPMIAGQEMMGALLLLTNDEEEISADEVELAHTLANQAAVALQNARLYEETRRFSEELERRVEERTAELQREHHRSQTLLKLTGELAGSLDLDQVLNRTLDLLNESLGAEHSSILLVRPDEENLYLRAARGLTERIPLGGRPSKTSKTDSLAGWVIAHREPVLIPDVLADPRWRIRPGGSPPPHRSVICVPLIFGEEVLGVLMLFHSEPNHFTEYHLDLATATAKQMAITINQSEIFRLINEQAERLGRMARAQEVEARRAKAILEAIADGVIVTDKQNIITLFNPSASRILSLPAEKAIGRPLSDFIGLFGAAGKQWMETIHMWSENPEMSAEGITYEEQLELDDGRVISVHLAPVFFRDGFLGTVSVFRDITHQVEVDRLKSEFVATVSHELRTPMTAIKGYVDILLMGAAGPLTDQQRRFLNTVKSNTDRLNLLVSDLLDISRIEAGHIALVKEEIDLAALIEEVIAEAKRRANEENRPMEFKTEIAPDLPPVIADRERIRQVIENLVENAYRYTPEGGKVTVTAHLAEGNKIQVDVSDTGIGIPPEEQERVFERFYRGENPLVMASAGTGLGLAIVKTLVEMHGGEIWVESEGIPGKGSTFSFTLPLEAENSAEAQAG